MAKLARIVSMRDRVSFMFALFSFVTAGAFYMMGDPSKGLTLIAVGLLFCIFAIFSVICSARRKTSEPEEKRIVEPGEVFFQGKVEVSATGKYPNCNLFILKSEDLQLNKAFKAKVSYLPDDVLAVRLVAFHYHDLFMQELIRQKDGTLKPGKRGWKVGVSPSDPEYKMVFSP